MVPRRRAAPAGDQPGGAVGNPAAPFGRGASAEAQMHAYNDVLHAKDKRDPRGYIIPADQPDFLTAIKFVNTLRHVGVYVDQATAAFTVDGKQYPAGSFVIKTTQAARAHVLDMMEPQDHPNDFAYPGGPPRRPYDNAGWTLAYEMGVQVRSRARRVRRADEAHRRPGQAARRHGRQRAGRRGLPDVARRERRGDGDQPRVQGRERRSVLAQVAGAGERQDVSGRHVLRDRQRVCRCFRSRPRTSASTSSACRRVRRDATKVSSKRIALYDQYGGSMPSGWTRLEFENFEIPYDGRLPERSRRRQPQVQVRRADPPVRRADSRRGRRGAADVAVVAAAVVAVVAAVRSRPSSRRCRER